MGYAFKENILSWWASGRLQGHELIERAGIMGINTFSRSYKVLCLKILGGHSPAADELVEKIGMALSAVYDCNSFIDSSAVHVYILGGHEVDAIQVRNHVQAIIDGYGESIMVFGAVGIDAAGRAEVPASYKSACDLFHFSMLFPRNQVVLSDALGRDTFQIPQVDTDAFCRLNQKFQL
jgi:hypothetical protein